MGNLFFSFLIAICGAIGLVTLSRTFDLEMYTTRIFPLIPLLYAIIYETLEKKRSGRNKTIPPAKAKEEMKAGAAALFQNITPGRIVTDIGVSFAIKFFFEILFVAFYLTFNGQSFSKVYGVFGIETIGRFLRGDHPWITGAEGLYLLTLLALSTSFGTGLWIGYTSRGKAILEGVIAGAVVTMITAMTNMLILYRMIEEAADQMAASMGYATHIGFIAVITLQVLLYGLWSGLAQKAKDERVAAAALKKSAKKPRK